MKTEQTWETQQAEVERQRQVTRDLIRATPELKELADFVSLPENLSNPERATKKEILASELEKRGLNLSADAIRRGK